MVVVDLRGEDRASGHIAGTVHVRAMDLLKEIQKFAEMFRDQPIVAFFCKYSAHRAPTAAGWITCLSVPFLFSDFKSCTTTVQNPLQKQQFQQGKPKQQGLQLLQKELPVQTARDDPGWEAHDLRVQQMETTLSKKACDELALKVGKDVSKLQCIIATSTHPSRSSWPAGHTLSGKASSPSAANSEIIKA